MAAAQVVSLVVKSNLCDGLVNPIPTFPELSIRILSILLVLNNIFPANSLSNCISPPVLFLNIILPVDVFLKYELPTLLSINK
jgi:hypothetical protein